MDDTAVCLVRIMVPGVMRYSYSYVPVRGKGCRYHGFYYPCYEYARAHRTRPHTWFLVARVRHVLILCTITLVINRGDCCFTV